MTESDVSAFLYFGYVPRLPNDLASDPLIAVRRECPARVPDEAEAVSPARERELVAEGVSALLAAFEEGAAESHLVPLSGGFDSRAVLAGVLTRRAPSEVQTITWGVPGTYDYELAPAVAAAAGVRHERLDLLSLRWSTEALVEVARQCGRLLPFFDCYVPTQVWSRLAPGTLYWSGYMGDSLSGSHLPRKGYPTWPEAVTKFIKRNRIVGSASLAPPGFRPRDLLPQEPWFDAAFLDYYDQIDYAVRQQSYIRPSVIPPGRASQAPFLQPAWLRFILGVPRGCRLRQNIYRKILQQAFPRLFHLPSTRTYGLRADAPEWRLAWGRAMHRAWRYARRHFPRGPWGSRQSGKTLDYDASFRTRDDLQALVRGNLQDLQRRGLVPWVDIDGLWASHQRGEANHGTALHLLAALEIALKAGL